MNIESILFKSKKLTSQMIGVYELSLSGFSQSDLVEMIGVAADLCSSLHDDIQSNLDASKRKNTVLTSSKIKTHNNKHQDSFTERLKFALKEQGMTRAALAESIGVSQSTISSLAGGRKEVDSQIANDIANAMDVSFRWLMHGEGGIYGAISSNQSNEV